MRARSLMPLGTIGLGGLIALAACRDDPAGPARAGTVPNVPLTTPTALPPAPTEKTQRPVPFDDGPCISSCANLEAIGPTSILDQANDDFSAIPRLAYGRDQFVVAWGGAPNTLPAAPPYVQLQRFTFEGQPEGPAKRIDGVALRDLLWDDTSSELVVHGSIPPYDAKNGEKQSLHRFDRALDPLGEPLAFRTPAGEVGTTALARGPGGAVILTQTLSRTAPLVRNIELKPALGIAQTPIQRDWYLRDARFFSVAPTRIDGRFFVAYSQGRGVHVARLDDGGAQHLVSTGISDLGSDNVTVWSKVIGRDWWVAGVALFDNGERNIALQRLDRETGTPLGERIELRWLSGVPVDLIDANGSPVVVGYLEPTSAPYRAWFVPIDTTNRKFCRPLSVREEVQSYQTVRGYHFVGETGGVVFETTTADRTRHLYFTRIACRR